MAGDRRQNVICMATIFVIAPRLTTFPSTLATACLNVVWFSKPRYSRPRPPSLDFLSHSENGERFIAAAPLEEFTALVWFFKRLYGWPFHWVLFRIHNDNPNRPKLAAVPEATRKRLETLNQYDIEVYEWVKARFAKQIQSMEPHFSREVGQFAMLNRAVNRIDRLFPQPIRKLAHRLLFPSG